MSRVDSDSQDAVSLIAFGHLDGIVEEGEDCDPGSNASSSCCDASSKHSRLSVVEVCRSNPEM